MRSPAQAKAIAASYQDKEKLLKTGATAPIKPPKIGGALGGIKGAKIPKPALAKVPDAPAFGHKRLFYGEIG